EITRHTPDPAGGVIVRDARGEPTGLLVDTAQRLVPHGPPPPHEGPFPARGVIVRAARGDPPGCLVDTAQRLVAQVQPPPDEARFDAAVREAIAQCLAAGLTGLHEMGADLRALAAYRRLAERGQFPIRYYVAGAGPQTVARGSY